MWLAATRREAVLRAGSRLWLPVGIWLAATAVVLVTCALDGRSPFRPDTWAYGDPGLYMDIARRGYTLFPCVGRPGDWCGNAGWFPGYPWLMRWVSDLGIGVGTAGLVLSWLFSLGTLVLLSTGFLRARGRVGAALVLVYAALAPGSIFGYALYPLSMLAFCTVAYLLLVDRGRWLAAGLVGYALVLVYPTAVATPASVALYIVVAYRAVPLAERARRIALASGPAALSLGLLFLQLDRTVGHWDAYFLVQEKYGHRLTEPLAPAVHAVRTLFGASSPSLLDALSLETLLVDVVVAAVVIVVVRRRAIQPGAELLFLLWAIAAWAVPESTTHLSGNRGDAALLPIALLVGMLPRRIAMTLALAAAALFVPLELLYLRNALA
jgi:hypothetical protein